VRNNLDLSITLLRDLDGITKVTNTAVDLNLVLEELLEGGDVENLVAGGLRSVDDELLRNLGLLALGGFSGWCHFFESGRKEVRSCAFVELRWVGLKVWKLNSNFFGDVDFRCGMPRLGYIKLAWTSSLCLVFRK